MQIKSKNKQKIRVIDGSVPSLTQYLLNVWNYRHLILTLTKRDLKVKYAQTALGFLWAVIQPLTGLLIFTIFFDKLIKVDTNGIPYPLFAFSGIVTWYFFTYTMAAGGVVLSESGEIIKKIYFPRLVLPITKMLMGFVDFLISLGLLVILMLIFQVKITWAILFLPILIILNALIGLAVAIWLSALTIQYRDFQHIIPYLLNFGIWLTPVFYPGTLIPDAYQFLLYINPMAALLAAFRWAMLGDVVPHVGYLISLIPVLLMFFTGILYFRKIEDDIADYI